MLAPACASAFASARMRRAPASSRPCTRKPPSACTDWGTSPTWPHTGTPRSVRKSPRLSPWPPRLRAGPSALPAAVRRAARKKRLLQAGFPSRCSRATLLEVEADAVLGDCCPGYTLHSRIRAGPRTAPTSVAKRSNKPKGLGETNHRGGEFETVGRQPYWHLCAACFDRLPHRRVGVGSAWHVNSHSARGDAACASPFAQPIAKARTSFLETFTTDGFRLARIPGSASRCSSQQGL